jgi:hypothetical protein
LCRRRRRSDEKDCEVEENQIKILLEYKLTDLMCVGRFNTQGSDEAFENAEARRCRRTNFPHLDCSGTKTLSNVLRIVEPRMLMSRRSHCSTLIRITVKTTSVYLNCYVAMTRWSGI